MIKLTVSLILFSVSVAAQAQKVFSVQYGNQADVKVYVVKYENQADLKVFKVKYENQAGENNGKWFFTEYANQAKKKIYFVEYENQADLKIYFVEYENQAGWRNKEKDPPHVLDGGQGLSDVMSAWSLEESFGHRPFTVNIN